MRTWLAQVVFRSPLYLRYVLDGPIPSQLHAFPCHLPGDRTQADAILAEEFLFFGRRVPFAGKPWTMLPPGPRLARALHGFTWLRDLEAVGTDAARARALALVMNWIAVNRRWTQPAWAPAVLGERLASWLATAHFLLEGASGDDRVRFLEATGRQARHLARVSPRMQRNEEVFAALAGEIAAAVSLRVVPLAPPLRRLETEIGRQIAADGGHASRNPSTQLHVFRHLVDIHAALANAGETGSSVVAGAIERMAPMLRALRHGDGRLALFQGAKESDRTVIDSLLAAGRVGTAALSSAPDTGYERLVAGRTLVLVDTGVPAENGHAAPLAFELSHGRERIIVNCGAYGGDDPRWRRALQSTPAHSTLSVADAGAVERPGLGRRSLRVQHLRQEAEGAVWLEGSHDGYRRRYGLTHRRRLFLAANGGDLRGEDTLEGKRGRGFRIRFHLHPDIQAASSEDGASVLLHTATGAAWRFLAVGGTLSLEESTYLGASDQPRPCRQIVVAGSTAKDGARVKWALRQDSGAS